MEFDKSKENIQPLANGRNASILQASMSHTIEELLEQRREFEKAINSYVGNDPLEPWYTYISWIEQSFPSGGKESGLMEVLSKCLRRFESEECYYQDPRMIKLFIKFLDSHKDSSECYQQLYNAGIGTMVADFYIAWAYCYDSIGQMRKADEILRRGIECRAQPLAELKEAHQHFSLVVAQRTLYKDNQDTLQDTNRQIEERRLALSSLRGYRDRNCKGQIGSIRTGMAILSFKPGTVADGTNRVGQSSSKSRVNVSVLADENANENFNLAENTYELAADSKEMPSSSVVRSIVDKARHQENERDPGPWNKVNDKNNKKQLIRQKKVVHNLCFNIHEDRTQDGSENQNENESSIDYEQIVLTEAEQNYNKPFKYPPNFVSKNRPQPEWILPITTECQPDGQSLPCYNKCMIYPRPNREFQSEELQAYLYYKKRGITNTFTQRYKSVWGNDITVPIRLYPNFARTSRKQELSEVDKFFVPPTHEGLDKLVVPLKEIYNIEKEEEFQNEELMESKMRKAVSETVIELEDMDETMCASSNNEQVQRRKSFFPTRRSLAIRSIIAAKMHNESNERSLQSSIHEEINKSTTYPDEVPKAKTYVACKEATSVVEKAGTTVENSDSDFHFKTPALPTKIVKPTSEIQVTESPALSNLPFEIYVEDDVRIEKPAPLVFDVDETFSTQVFNNFIKTQSASTPKPTQKFLKHDFGNSDEMASSAQIATIVGNATTETATSSPVDVPTNSYSPLLRKQLSTILETSEHGAHSTGTSSKSTNGSQESELSEAATNLVQHQNMCNTQAEMTAKPSNCQSTLRCETESLDDLTIDSERLIARPNQKPTPFLIYVDETETLLQMPKAESDVTTSPATGKFDRMIEREDMVGTCYSDHSMRFQDDKTETVTKMVAPYLFQDDKTGTIPKLHDSIYPINSIPTTVQHIKNTSNALTSTITQTCFKPVENDDYLEDFRKSPAKIGGKFHFHEAVSSLMVNHKKHTISGLETVQNTSKGIDKANSELDFLNFFENDSVNYDGSNQTKTLVTNSTGYGNSNMKSVEKNIGNSFFPELSLIAERNPHTSSDSSKEDLKNIKKAQNATNGKKEEENNFSLSEFSFIGESQPLNKSVAKPFKQTDSSCNSVIAKTTQDSSTEAMQKDQKREDSNLAQKSINMPKINLQKSFLPSISIIDDSLRACEKENSPIVTCQPPSLRVAKEQHTRTSHIPKPSSIKKHFNDSGKRADVKHHKTVFDISKDNSFIPETQEISMDNIESNQKSQRTLIQVDRKCSSSSNSLKEYSKERELNEQSTVKNKNSLSAPIFELNAETEMFSTGISMIKNSTMRNSQPQRPPSLLKSNSEATNSELENCNRIKEQQFKSTYLDNDMSIYFKHTPRTPVLQIHDKSWSSDSEDAGHYGFECEYLHHEIDLNETNQRVHDICKDENVNPFNPDLLNALLDKIDFVNSLNNLKNTNLVARIPRLKTNSAFNVGRVDFKVTKLIAEGAYGTVFRGVEKRTGKEYAFKQERPPNYWEYYICLEVRNRIVNKELLTGFMQIDYALIGNNASIFVSSLSTYGSLIVVCNKIKKHTLKNVDEYVVMHLTCELLEIMDHLHSTSIIHADIKADNFLLMKKLVYNGKEPSLQLIDFGVSIDMRLFKPNQTFTFVHNDVAFKCVEMRENRPWTFQLDLYGLAGIIHVLLFGKYMDIEKRDDKYIWMPTTHMPRYINKVLWESIFRALLNIRDCKNMPNLQQLRSMIKEEIAEKERYVISKIAEFNKALNS